MIKVEAGQVEAAGVYRPPRIETSRRCVLVCKSQEGREFNWMAAGDQG